MHYLLSQYESKSAIVCVALSERNEYYFLKPETLMIPYYGMMKQKQSIGGLIKKNVVLQPRMFND